MIIMLLFLQGFAICEMAMFFKSVFRSLLAVALAAKLVIDTYPETHVAGHRKLKKSQQFQINSLDFNLFG